MEKFDCIVIGAGNGGLVSALTLQKKGKKVLILEKGLAPGGLATSFRRGRFEFDVRTHELCGYGGVGNTGEIDSLFERLGIDSKIEMMRAHETFHVIDKLTKDEYTMPVGVDHFIEKMEEYVPGSRDAMTTFFGLCEDIKDALSYLYSEKGAIDEKDLYQKFPNFVQLAPYKVDAVLEKIKMPKKAIEILSTYWVYFGSAIDDVSFVHYASIVYSYVLYGPAIPKYTSHELSRVLENEFKSAGGTIYYLSEVEKIDVEDGEVTGVQTKNQTFVTSHVIANLSPKVVYGKMIQKENVPVENCQLENERILGAREITVYLGLNASLEDIGLHHSTYFLSNNLNSKVEYKKMQEVFHGNVVGFVPNVINAKASPDGTCILTLTSLIFGDGFDKLVSKENYFDVKEQFGDYLIRCFEETTGISIREYIEEIEIATPLTFARYTGHPSGAIYGYMAKGYDNLLPRTFSEEEETRIKGLRFCGGFGSRLSDFSSTYLNGEDVAMKTLGE